MNRFITILSISYLYAASMFGTPLPKEPMGLLWQPSSKEPYKGSLVMVRAYDIEGVDVYLSFVYDETREDIIDVCGSYYEVVDGN